MTISPAVDTLLNIGDTVALTAIVNGRTAGPSDRISWTTLNAGVAVVNALGAVRAVASGTALIVASVGEVGDTATIVVSPATLTRLALAPNSITVAPGTSSQFKVSGTWSDGSSTVPTVTYSATGGTITDSGLYTAGTTPGFFSVIATQRGGTRADTSIVIAVQAPSLRLLAAGRNFAIGAAVDMDAFRAHAQYRQTLATQYNSVVGENAMKFSVIHPEPAQYAFSDADQLVSFALAHGMEIHGHSLVWHNSLPPWITGGNFTRIQLLGVLRDHITTVVGRYAGKIASWDVVNEAVTGDGALRPTPWLTIIGPEYVDSAFAWAHRADPTAKLFYNDYQIEAAGAKSDSVFALLQRLRARGVQIDGVGFQAHSYPATPLPAEMDINANLTHFANAGYVIRITELDVMIPDTASAPALTAQAVVYRNVLDACLLQPQCKGVTTWGFTDRYSWIPASFPGFGRGLPFDGTYLVKPAFDSLAARLRRP